MSHLRLVTAIALFWSICTLPSAATACATDRECSHGETCIVQKLAISPDTEPQEIGTCENRSLDGVTTINCYKDAERGCLMSFSGSITSQKVNYIEQILATSEIGSFGIGIESPGGDVQAAMKLGRLLRKHEASIYSRYSGRSVCASACIFVFAGAPKRSVAGQMLIHRPYGAKGSVQDVQATAKQWKELQSSIRTYLEEMNIPGSLLDAINAVPSDKPRELTKQELSFYMLDQDDPVYVETQDAKRAAKLGISRTELLARKMQVEKCQIDVAARYRKRDMDFWASYEKCSTPLHAH